MNGPEDILNKVKDFVEEKLNIDVDPMLEKAIDVLENVTDHGGAAKSDEEVAAETTQ